MSLSPEPTVRPTAIPGLLIIDLPVHADGRGWFKENWQRAKMSALGLPDFGPVQNNVSFNATVGVTRGVHAEPWDKLVSVAAGRVFGAWVDLREGPQFGTVVTHEIGPDTAVFVPRGVGNAFQTLAAGTAYSYLVNDHWSAQKRAEYTFVNLADPQLAIAWPIPLERAELSQADRTHPKLVDVTPMPWRQTVVLGAGGQLGQALGALLPSARLLTRGECDLADPVAVDGLDLSGVDTIVNAAAYTGVDTAETPQGRIDAWATNVTGLTRLVARCAEHGVRLVHVSSDYVFDGTREVHDEDEPFSPLGVYGQTKAAGDAVVATLPRHLIVRTSWVVGAGRNFVTTMAGLAQRGVEPNVVDDQFGRLTFADDLADGIVHLLHRDARGTFNLSNTGPVQTWADIAADIFELCGRSRDDVHRVSAEEYAAGVAGKGGTLAPRPRHSALRLDRIEATGFVPRPASQALRSYLQP